MTIIMRYPFELECYDCGKTLDAQIDLDGGPDTEPKQTMRVKRCEECDESQYWEERAGEAERKLQAMKVERTSLGGCECARSPDGGIAQVCEFCLSARLAKTTEKMFDAVSVCYYATKGAMDHAASHTGTDAIIKRLKGSK